MIAGLALRAGARANRRSALHFRGAGTVITSRTLRTSAWAMDRILANVGAGIVASRMAGTTHFNG